MEIITVQTYSSIVLGAGYILYLPSNHTHYVITSVNGDDISLRPILYSLGNYGTEFQTKRRALVGMAIIYGGWG